MFEQGSDPARPEDETNPATAPIDPAAPGAQPGVDPQSAAPAPGADEDPEDVDVIEWNQAKAAMQAEDEAAAAGTTDDTATEGTAPQGTASPQPAAGANADAQGQQPGQPPQSIPYPRFVEVNQQAQENARAAAYWQGVAEARAAGVAAPTNGAGPQPQAPTPEQQIAAIRTEAVALATRFDNGEITAAKWEAEKAALADREYAIREQVLTTRIRPQEAPRPQQPQIHDVLYLDSLTAKLENDHPWVKVFDRLEEEHQVNLAAEWAYLRERAVDNLVSRKIDPSAGDRGKYELRKEIATLATQFGPSLVGALAKQHNIAVPGTAPAPAPAQGQPPQLSPAAKARLAKHEQANGAPPDLTALAGAGGTGTGEITDAQLEAMSDDDIAALPPGVRQRILGTTAA